MNEFEYLKEQARQAYRGALHHTELAEKSKLQTRHAADQAQGAKVVIETLLQEAPEDELPAVRDAYARVVAACLAAEESYLKAESAHMSAASATEKARQRFLVIFKEEP